MAGAVGGEPVSRTQTISTVTPAARKSSSAAAGAVASLAAAGIARRIAGDRAAAVREIVADDVAVWAAGVELVMEELAAGDLLPGRIYLCGGGSRLPEIQAALADPAFAAQLPFARPPEVTILSPDQIDTVRDETRLLEDQQDVTPMGLAYQAIELGSSQNPLDASLRRVIRAMKP